MGAGQFFKVVASPPRVGSRKQWISGLTANISAARLPSGTRSLSSCVEELNRPRWLSTAMPWSPIVPLRITLSSGLALPPTIESTKLERAFESYRGAKWPCLQSIRQTIHRCVDTSSFCWGAVTSPDFEKSTRLPISDEGIDFSPLYQCPHKAAGER